MPFGFCFWVVFGFLNFVPFIAASHACTTKDISEVLYEIILRVGGGDPMNRADPDVNCCSGALGARAGSGAGDGGGSAT